MVPAPHPYIDKQLTVLLDPFAASAGLVATSEFNLGEKTSDFRVPDGGYHRIDWPGRPVPFRR